MNQSLEETGYKPGYYDKKRLGAAEWAEQNIKKWRSKSSQKEMKFPSGYSSVCISRQVGVGALEIADLLSGILEYRVVDREILEHMAKNTRVAQKVIEVYDERYPGKMSELFSMLISEKTFVKSDYARQLVKTVSALANTDPTIFVGRGTHLILPRKTILSVRLFCSREYRVDRLAKILGITTSEAAKKLTIIDIEQHEFFKTVYHKKGSSLEEFDLVINRDHIGGALETARIIASAFEQRFGLKKK